MFEFLEQKWFEVPGVEQELFAVTSIEKDWVLVNTSKPPIDNIFKKLLFSDFLKITWLDDPRKKDALIWELIDAAKDPWTIAEYSKSRNEEQKDCFLYHTVLNNKLLLKVKTNDKFKKWSIILYAPTKEPALYGPLSSFEDYSKKVQKPKGNFTEVIRGVTGQSPDALPPLDAKN